MGAAPKTLADLITDRGLDALAVAEVCDVLTLTVRRWMRSERIAPRYAAPLASLFGEEEVRHLFEAQGPPPIGSGRRFVDRKGTYRAAARLARQEGRTELAGALQRALDAQS